MTKKGVKLIAPDEKGILCYQGACKVIIDPIYKVLQIHPKNFEEFFNISVLFEKKFIQKKNLLFIFGEYNFQDFVLVFKNELLCKRVHDIIYKHKEEEEDHIQENELQQRLLIPIFQIMAANNYSTRFKKAMSQWIESHDENEKKELLKLLKKQKRNHQILDVKNIKQESKNILNPRKRRFSEMTNSNTAGANVEEYRESLDYNLNNVKTEYDEIQIQIEVTPPSNAIKIIEKSLFEIVNVKRGNRCYKKLLIFTSAERTNCYEYKFHPSKQIIYQKRNSIGNGIKAILKLDESGKECIELEDKKHVCSPIQYDPRKYNEMKIFKKPYYEIVDNRSTKSKRMLIIFDSNDKNRCYEYYWNSKQSKFHCCGCNMKKKRRTAEIVHENTDAEYISIINNQHVCKTRKYNPEKFNQEYQYVLSPNFEIQTKVEAGIERKNLIIFYGNDRNLCYSYYFNTSKKLFYCNGCRQQRKKVSAKIYQNDDGEDYVILSNVKHGCYPTIDERKKKQSTITDFFVDMP